MNEHELDLTLDAVVLNRTQVTAPPILREHVRTVPFQTRRQRSWLPQSPKWRFGSMFGATRFVVAGAVVALFGGLLLAGVLTQPSEEATLPPAGASSSPTTDAVRTSTPDLLPGVDLITEEVEPGVYRVLSDGVRAVDWKPTSEYAPLQGTIVVAPDGGIWNVTLPRSSKEDCPVSANVTHQSPTTQSCHLFYRLGSPESYRLPEGWQLGHPNGHSLQPGPDGQIWALVSRVDESRGRQEVWSFDGKRWTTRRKGADEAEGRIASFAIGSDGIAWTLEHNARNQSRIGRSTDDGWISRGGLAADRALIKDVADQVYVVGPDGAVARAEDFDDGSAVEPMTDLLRADPHGTRIGGGMVWWDATPQEGSSTELVRYDGSDYRRFEVDPEHGRLSLVGVGQDGAAWLSGTPLGGVCDGLIRVDESGTKHFLTTYCPTAVDLTPDGQVWLQAVQWTAQPLVVETFVIAPEAVAAAEWR